MQGPVGRIGRPPDRRAYQRFEVKGIVLFIEEGLLKGTLNEQGSLKVLMGDYGTWILRFS